MAAEQRHTICRACHVQCGLIVTLEDGRPVKVHGDKDNPAYAGYSCIKGRELGAYHSAPSRLLHSRKRMDNGGYAPIASGAAIAQIADRVKALVDAHGPRSVALYIGTHGYNNFATQGFGMAFLDAIGSPMLFTSVTIDQPGKGISAALHGVWLAGQPAVADLDCLMLVGTNPIISMNGGLGMNPAKNLHEGKARGLKLIVIDPRRSECAREADIHLQVRPGEDAPVLGAMIRLILDEGLADLAFLAGNADGLSALRAALDPYTLDMAAQRAGVPADAIAAAARLFASSPKAATSAGTGPNMSGRGNLVEYLLKVLTSVSGKWQRAGDTIRNPGVLINRMPALAASPGPMPGWGFGETLRVKGFTDTTAGLPTAALADEILTGGEGQVKALFVLGGNPMMAWPDQLKAFEAMKALDLLVCLDPHMSATARLAHYVIAPKLPFEIASTTALNEFIGNFGVGWGYQEPYAQYCDPLVAPPEGSDVIEDWELFHGMAGRLGLDLTVKSFAHIDPRKGKERGTTFRPGDRPPSDDVWSAILRDSPVPFDQVKALGSRGHVFERQRLVVQDKPPGWTGRVQVGDPVMMGELADIAGAAPGADDFAFKVISRRMNDVLNSAWHEHGPLQRRYSHNPAFMAPADAARLGLATGDVIALASARAEILGVVEVDDTVREGCIAMTHAWGANPDEDDDPFAVGGNTGRLTSVDADYDPYTGIPRMSAIPVNVRRVARAAVAAE